MSRNNRHKLLGIWKSKFQANHFGHCKGTKTKGNKQIIWRKKQKAPRRCRRAFL